MKVRALQLVFAISLMLVTVWGAGGAPRSIDRPEKVERTTPAESTVTVSLCVLSSNVTVRGWDKDEVMVQSMEGALIQFKREPGGDESKPASKLEVLVVDKEDARRREYYCQAATDLHLMVPTGATVHIQTRDGSIEITDVAKAFAGSQDGDVVLEKISSGAEVGTIGGSITVSDSTGRMDLNTVGGNVVACDVGPNDSAESFESTTVSGNIDLTEVGHALLNLRTTTGNMTLTGPLASSGKYGFGTMSGNVTLALPSESSFQLNAKISSNGDIITDFPLTLLSQSVSTSQSPKPGKAPRATTVAQAPVDPAGAQSGAAAQASATTPVAQGKASKTAPTTPPQPSAAPGTPATTPQPLSTPQPEAPIVVKVDPKITVTVPREGMTVRVNPSDIKISPVIVHGHTLRRVSAICGTGDATISVASFSGTLHLQKHD